MDLGKPQAVQDQNHLNVDHQNQVSIKKLIMVLDSDCAGKCVSCIEDVMELSVMI